MVQSARVGRVNPDVNKFYTAPERVTNNPGLLDGLLQIITPGVTKLASAKMQVNQEEAYLAGSAAAGSGQAEADVESNILTKDWATAGYHDTAARLRSADAEAQTAADMKRLRELPPAEFANYLAERRSKLYADAGEMSLPARKSMLGQQLVSERAAIQTHATQHQAFIIDQESKAVSADVSAKFSALDASKVDVKTYQAATVNAYGSIYGNVWQNQRLPRDVKLKLTTQAFESALSQNHQGLFAMMRHQSIAMPDGSSSTMFDQLPFDDQVKLVKANESSMSATKDARDSEYNSQVGLMLASFKDTTSPVLAKKDLDAFLADGIQRKAISSGDVRSITEQWAAAGAKKAKALASANAWLNGDSQTMFNLSKTDDEGYADRRTIQAASKMPLDQVVNENITTGLRTGSSAAFKGVGKDLEGPLAQLKPDAPGNATNAAILGTVLKRMDANNDKPGYMVNMLSGMNEDARAKLTTFRYALQETGNPDMAAQAAIQEEIDTANVKPELRRELRQNSAKEDAKLIQGIDATQLWGALSKKALDFVGLEPSDRDKIRTGRYWFEDPTLADAQMMASKSALAEALTRVGQARPYSSASQRQELALADVASRTLETDGGLVIIPPLLKGASMQSYFGVAPHVLPGTIAASISEKFQPKQPGNRLVFKATDSGIMFQELRADGGTADSGTFDPRTMRDIIAEKDKARSAKFQEVSGDGITAGTGTAKVQFNGDHTVEGLPPEQMLEFRKTLVKYEGVRDKEYDDGSGNATIGVGILQRKKDGTKGMYAVQVDKEGKAPTAALNYAFRQASNDAAQAGMVVATQYRTGPQGFPIMAELAYQSGNSFFRLPGYQPFLKAMGAKDQADALAQFQKTPAWESSAEVRQQHYLEMIRRAIPVASK